MSKKNQKLSDKEYQQLGRRLENIYLTGYLDKKEMVKMTFLKGIVMGLGSVIGATIVVAILAWVLSLFDTLPLLGPLAERAQDTVQSQTK